MKISDTLYNIECDCCGCILDDEHMYHEEEIYTIASYSDFKHLGDRDYCPDCWSVDDDGYIITKDGHKYDYDTYEEII